MTTDVTFVVFGATGHLARTKLLPALARIVSAEGLSSHAIVGVGSRDRTTEEFLSVVTSSLEQADVPAEEADRFLRGAFAYQAVSDDASYAALADAVSRIESDRGLSGNRVLYLAVPPSKLDGAVAGISKCAIDDGGGWTRLVVEKPFGVDLETAKTSNAIIHRTFTEEQVYRIDHFLGKETVRNLLVFRFSNSLFEQTWNRRHIESVEITVAEDVVGGNGALSHVHGQRGVGSARRFIDPRHDRGAVVRCPPDEPGDSPAGEVEFLYETAAAEPVAHRTPHAECRRRHEAVGRRRDLPGGVDHHARHAGSPAVQRPEGEIDDACVGAIEVLTGQREANVQITRRFLPYVVQLEQALWGRLVGNGHVVSLRSNRRGRFE